LQGDTAAALAGFDKARLVWESLGARLHLALNRIHLVLLCPGTPEAAAAAGDARRLAAEMGAPTLLTMLERATAATAPR